MSNKFTTTRRVTLMVAALAAFTLAISAATAAAAAPTAPPVPIGGSSISFMVPSAIPSTDAHVGLQGRMYNIGRGSSANDFSLVLICGSRAPIPVDVRTEAEGNVLLYLAQIPVEYVDWECKLSASTTRSGQSIKFTTLMYDNEKGSRVMIADSTLVTYSKTGGL